MTTLGVLDFAETWRGGRGHIGLRLCKKSLLGLYYLMLGGSPSAKTTKSENLFFSYMILFSHNQ